MFIAPPALDFLLAPKERNVPCTMMHHRHGAPTERCLIFKGTEAINILLLWSKDGNVRSQMSATIEARSRLGHVRLE